MDLFVAWKGVIQNSELCIELKKDLKKKTNFDRLVGQIEGLDPKRNRVLVVLVGDTDAALLSRLREKYASLVEDESTATLAFVTVSPSKSKSGPTKKDDSWL